MVDDKFANNPPPLPLVTLPLGALKDTLTPGGCAILTVRLSISYAQKRLGISGSSVGRSTGVVFLRTVTVILLLHTI